MLRREAFHHMPAALWRFESAAVTTPQLAKAKGYAQNWDEYKKVGIGLLLFGDVGTKKLVKRKEFEQFISEKLVI